MQADPCFCLNLLASSLPATFFFLRSVTPQSRLPLCCRMLQSTAACRRGSRWDSGMATRPLLRGLCLCRARSSTPSSWLLGPQQVLAVPVLVLTHRQLSVAGAVQRSNPASRLLAPIRMQLTLLTWRMLLPMLPALQRGQESPVLLTLAPARLLPPVAESHRRRKQFQMLLVPTRTPQGALQGLLPACRQLLAAAWAWRGMQAMMLQDPAWPLTLPSLRGCNTWTGRRGSHPLSLTRVLLPMVPASLEMSAAWRKRVAAVRPFLEHRPMVSRRLLRGPLQVLELQLVTARVRRVSKVCWFAVCHCVVVRPWVLCLPGCKLACGDCSCDLDVSERCACLLLRSLVCPPLSSCLLLP